METTLPTAVIASAFVGLIGLFFGWLFGHARNNNYTQAQMNYTISDMVSNFLYYDRKEDEDLPRGAIEEAIEAGEISIREIVEAFRNELNRGLEVKKV